MLSPLAGFPSLRLNTSSLCRYTYFLSKGSSVKTLGGNGTDGDDSFTGDTYPKTDQVTYIKYVQPYVSITIQ